MDSKIVISDFLGEIESAFNHFNKHLFHNKLEKIPVVINPKRKVDLKFVPDSNSILIGYEIFSVHYEDLPSLLLHEMIHVSNFQSKIVDVTTNQYHNKNFCAKAVDVGFIVLRHKAQGWSITTTELPRNIVDENKVQKPNVKVFAAREKAFQNFPLCKISFSDCKKYIKSQASKGKTPKIFQLKYECKCPPPHNSIRSGRRPDGNNPLNILCRDCMSVFEISEES